MSLPSDEAILEVIKPHGGLATWVIKNYLRMQGYDCKTRNLLVKMRELQKDGKVNLCPYSRANNYVWRLPKNEH